MEWLLNYQINSHTNTLVLSDRTCGLDAFLSVDDSGNALVSYLDEAGVLPGECSEFSFFRVEEHAVYVLPLTLESYAGLYPTRIPKSLIREEAITRMTLSEIVCAGSIYLFHSYCNKPRIIKDLKLMCELLNEAHGLRMLPSAGNHKMLTDSYISLMDTSRNNLCRSYYDYYIAHAGGQGTKGVSSDSLESVEIIFTTP
jgi:hypothetical protein